VSGVEIGALLLDHLDSPERSADAPSGCSLVVEAEVPDDVRLTTAQDEEEP